MPRSKECEVEIVFLLSCQSSNFLVAMRLGETPVPIPNTMVKTEAADNTILVTVWESRWLPDLLKEKSTILIKCLTGD